MLSLLNVGNFKLNMQQGKSIVLSEHQIDRESLLLPEFFIDDLKSDPKMILKSTFDSLWNAAGIKRCEFYNGSGEWPIHESWLDGLAEKPT